jgi:uncharacterized protein (DUF362 family)
MKFSRRDLLRAGIAVGATSLLGKTAVAAGNPLLAALSNETKKTLVSIGGTNAERMVAKAFDLLGGIDQFLSPGDRVVVKPNASFANPEEWGNNTNPELVNAVCAYVKNAGARKVTVVDYPLMRGAEAPKINGIAGACKGMRGVKLSVLGQQHQFRPIDIPGAQTLKKAELSREVLDADLLINLPVAKAHDAVAASIGLKNLMGVIWDRTSFHTMMDIHKAIADLALAVRPALTLVDMSRVMTTNGPKGPGEIVTPKLLVASPDPVAADAYCLSKVRFNGRKFRPKQIKYLKYAHQAGLGEIDLKKLTIRKESV